MKKHQSILVIGDTHFPFTNGKVLHKIYDIANSKRPTYIVQMGDLYDAYGASRFAIDRNIITPREEIKQGHFQAGKMWAQLQSASPRSKCIQLRGNHDERWDKRVEEKLPEAMDLFNIRALFEFKSVETFMDPQEEVMLEGICFMHGHRSKLGDHARYNQMSTVCGHSHQGGVVYHRNLKGVYWELNAGWTGDEKQPVFAYGAQKRIRTWTTGVGLIDSMGPRFIPL